MNPRPDMLVALECHVRQLAGKRVLTANAAAETFAAIRLLTGSSDDAVEPRFQSVTPSPDAVLRAKFMLGQISEEMLTRRHRTILRRGGWAFGAITGCCFASPPVLFYALRDDVPVWFLVCGIALAFGLASIGAVVWTLCMHERLIGRWVKSIAFDSTF